MAQTREGAALTEQHRQLQLHVRALALRDFTRLWPTWNGGDHAFSDLVAATLPLVRGYHQISAVVAGSYYQAFRAAERVHEQTQVILADPIGTPLITASLYVTGKVETRKAIAAGKSAADARELALVRTSGAISRHILDGGRDTLIRSVQEDPLASGWARVTDGAPCAFCAMLAGRGPVYKSERTAEFRSHDHCGCMAEPFYGGGRAAWPGRAREFHALYQQATRDAAADGSLDRGTSNDLLNAFRRAYEAQRR